MYRHKGIYGYKKGYNGKATLALVLGILPNIPGFFDTIKLTSYLSNIDSDPNHYYFWGWVMSGIQKTMAYLTQNSVWQWISNLYNYAWFVGFFVSGIVYILLMRNSKTGIVNLVKKESK